MTGRELPAENLHVKPIEGLDGIKEAALKIERTQPAWSFLEGAELKVAVAHGLGNARKLLEMIRSGEAQYHFIEVMTCPGGCIGGAGTLLPLKKAEISVNKFMKAAKEPLGLDSEYLDDLPLMKDIK